MAKNDKRMISLLLCLFIVFSMLPHTLVMAQDAATSADLPENPETVQPTVQNGTTGNAPGHGIGNSAGNSTGANTGTNTDNNTSQQPVSFIKGTGATPDELRALEELDSMAIVGSGIPGLSEWNPADPAGDMTEIEAGVYAITLSLPAGTQMEFKFTGNDMWGNFDFGHPDGNFSGGTQVDLGQTQKIQRYAGNLYLETDRDMTVCFWLDMRYFHEQYVGFVLLYIQECAGGATADVPTIANAPAFEHWNWNYNLQEQEATCTTEGGWFGNCYECGAAFAATIPALNHAYETTLMYPTDSVNGIITYQCSSCGHGYDEEVDFEGTCGDHGYWKLDSTGTLTISGSGDMGDYSCPNAEGGSDASPWYPLRHHINNVIVGDGITGIGTYAFYDCTALTTVTMAESVTHIGAGSFGECDSLTAIALPEALTSLGVSAFGGCDNLNTIAFLGNAPVFGTDCFGSITATVSYPCANETWREDGLQNYGGTIIWQGHIFDEYVYQDDATCTDPGTMAAFCRRCGMINTIPASGSGLGHSFSEEGVCTACGTKGVYTINMTDSYGDGWNGCTIAVYVDNQLLTTATIESGSTASAMVDCIPGKIYNFKWISGNYPEECSFVICLNQEVLVSGVGSDYSDGQSIYSNCAHLYQTETTEPTCTEDGSTRQVCTLCGDSLVTVLFATGHSFDDNQVCTGCGISREDLVTTVYFHSAGSGWDPVWTYAWVWKGATVYEAFGRWPGTVMTDLGYGFYSIEVPDGYPNIIFDDGSADSSVSMGTQTVDLIIPDDGRNLYNFATGQWQTYIPCEHQSNTTVVAPTCNQSGYTQYTCGLCGLTYQDDVTAPLGHAFGEDGLCTVCGSTGEFVVNFWDTYGYGDLAAVEVYVDGTLTTTVRCTSERYTQVMIPYNSCKIYTFKWAEGNTGYYMNYRCEILFNQELLASGWEYEYMDAQTLYSTCTHQYETETTPAGCLTDGVIAKTCTICGDYVTESIPATGHSFTEDCVCAYCGCSSEFRIVMNAYGDGWYGCGIEVYEDGTMISTATVETGSSSAVYITQRPGKSYTFKWINGSAACNGYFDVWLNQEWLAGAYDPSYYDGQIIYSSCVHQFETKTVAPTCTENGMTIQTCSICTGVVQTTLPSTDHRFDENNVCINCGNPQADTVRTIYFNSNGSGWLEAWAYVWVEIDGVPQRAFGFWPGAAMTDLGYGIYSIQVSDRYPYIIFNNADNSGSASLGTQTVDLVIPDDGRNIYNFATGQWETYIPCDHEMQSTVQVPTCQQWGSTTHTCSICGFTYQDGYTEPLGHNFRDDGVCTSCGFMGTYTISLNQSCGNGCAIEIYMDGVTTAICELTSDMISSTWYIYSPEKTLTYKWITGDGPCGCSFDILKNGQWIASCLGSDYTDGQIIYCSCANAQIETIEPTCTEDGSITRVCSVCGVEEVTGLPATGHSYENGICTTCGAVDPDCVHPVVQPTLKLKYPTLSFEDMILMNVYFEASNLEDVVEMGLITYKSQVTEWDVINAEAIIPGYTWSESDGLYYATTSGIAAKDMGDQLYFAVYAQLTDGSYVYTRLVPYSPKTYADTLLNTGDPAMQSMVVAMLNYGAAAQTYFGYNTDALVNGTLTAEQTALVESYRSDMITAVTAPSAQKQGAFVKTGGYVRRYPTVSFEGAFSINYYFTPSAVPQGEITMYYWSQDAFDSVDVLTADNATAAISMTGSGAGEYHAAVEAIAAKDLDKGVYVAFVYTDGTTTYSSGVLAYSIGTYCAAQASGTDTTADLAKATAVYGYYAKNLFA